MKNVKLFLSAFVCAVLLSATGYSAEVESLNAKVKASEDVLRNQIVNTFSDFTFEKNVDVYVRFSVDSDNGFSLQDVISSDKAFAETVKSKLATKKLYAPSALSGSYQIKICFVKNIETDFKVSNVDVLRSILSENLTKVNAFEGGSVYVDFTVKSNALTGIKVSGKNASLAKSVETILTNSNVVVPEGIEGKYQVKVTY